MQKSERKETIKELNGKFQRGSYSVVAEFSKLSVETVTKLRRKFREGKVEYKVIKNTLARLAAKGTSSGVHLRRLQGPGGAGTSATDTLRPRPRSSPSSSRTWRRSSIRSAVVQGKRVDVEGVKALAKMPGLPELRAQLLEMLLPQPAGMLVPTPGSSRCAAGAGAPGQRRQGPRVQVTESRSRTTTNPPAFHLLGSVGRLDELRRKNPQWLQTSTR